MFDKLKKIGINKLGVDAPIFYTLLGRGLQIFTSLFTILFITKYLSSEEQGYYYTFGSIVAIQVFFELGLTTIITQFVAHEVSHLVIKDGEILGDNIYKSRLSSLLRFCAKWYLVFAIILFVVLMVVGLYFFSNYQQVWDKIVWKTPWILLAIGTVFNLLIAPIIAFVEGLGKVKEVAQIRFIQQIVHPIVLWGSLILGFKLFVPGIDAVLKVLVVAAIIYISPIKRLLKNIWICLGPYRVNYKKEIFPYQWKIGLSWISGYFIFQLFNPVLFATEGSVIAGRMGMTLTALNAIQALSYSWINTKVPRMSGLIAQKNYTVLDNLFNATIRQMLGIAAVIIFIFVLTISFLNMYNVKILGLDISSRFLPILPLILMSIATFLAMPVNAWATYLRCHKREPLLMNSIVIALLCCTSTILGGKYYGLIGIVTGFLCIRLISLIWTFLIFKNKKIDWHGNI